MCRALRTRDGKIIRPNDTITHTFGKGLFKGHARLESYKSIWKEGTKLAFIEDDIVAYEEKGTWVEVPPNTKIRCLITTKPKFTSEQLKKGSVLIVTRAAITKAERRVWRRHPLIVQYGQEEKEEKAS